MFLLFFFGSGCATVTGPAVKRSEIFAAQEKFKVKALEFRLKQLQQVNNIAYRLLKAIPQEEVKIADNPQPFLGLYFSEIDAKFRQLYNLSQNRGLVAILVIQDSPAEKAGFFPGDILIAVNQQRVNSLRDFNLFARNLNINDQVEFQVKRGQAKKTIVFNAGSIPVNIPVLMVDDHQVNAAAGSKAIYVTYGLLNFAASDDEIAAVLAHEIAHFVRGHVSRSQLSSLLSMLVAVPLGITAERAAPGTGDLVLRGGEIFRASYSRDLEREADYFGVKFLYYAGFDPCVFAFFHERFAIEIPHSIVKNYLSSHPSSPERMLRVKKAVEEITGRVCLP